MSEYTDEKGNTMQITNTVVLTEEEKECLENEIIEQLYKIFTHK